MCGIAGWIDWSRDLSGERAIVAAMTERLEARGPDAHGLWLDGHAALGHRRLSVIDLSANGAQPMRFERDGRTWAVVYNGEIYNHRELGRDLEARGHRFRSTSDTEVLLLAYVEWARPAWSAWTASSPSRSGTRRRGPRSWRAIRWA